MRFTAIILSLLITGCGWFTKPDPIVIHEEQCEALRIVPFPAYNPEPIDISAYESIQLFIEGEDASQVCMSVEDYKKFMQLLRETSSYIENQNIIIRKMRDFYEQGLDREGLDQ